MKDEVKGQLLLNVVVGQRVAILELFPSKDETLLVRGMLHLSHCLDHMTSTDERRATHPFLP